MRPIGSAVALRPPLEASSSQAAPSVICELLPAVTLPYLRSKKGFSLARFPSRNRAHAVVGCIDLAVAVDSAAARPRRSGRRLRGGTRWWLRTENSSICSRLMPKRAARFSAVWPISRPTTGSVRPFMMPITGSSMPGSVWRTAPRAGPRRFACAICANHSTMASEYSSGARDSASTPPASTRCERPALDVGDGRIERLHAGGAVAHHRPARHASRRSPCAARRRGRC
jgi:hypothetical protein